MSAPSEVGGVGAVDDVEASLHRAEGDLALTVGTDDQHGRAAEVEVVSAPQVRIDDPLVADDRAWRLSHVVEPSCLGNRTRL